jgi:hypothetical protein
VLAEAYREHGVDLRTGVAVSAVTQRSHSEIAVIGLE